MAFQEILNLDSTNSHPNTTAATIQDPLLHTLDNLLTLYQLQIREILELHLTGKN